uniref:Uncharacterized protein n=1 Tax=Echinococcus granulosus TaxID=6210 RepID=A0A068WBP9_ECHGR|nr:hypothetical protein EgrG_000986100 [Echinococcus granulosus]
MRRHDDDDDDDDDDNPYEQFVYSVTRLYNQLVGRGARVFAPLRLAIRTREVHPSLLTDTTQRGLIDSPLDAGTHLCPPQNWDNRYTRNGFPTSFLFCIAFRSCRLNPAPLTLANRWRIRKLE